MPQQRCACGEHLEREPREHSTATASEQCFPTAHCGGEPPRSAPRDRPTRRTRADNTACPHPLAQGVRWRNKARAPVVLPSGIQMRETGDAARPRRCALDGAPRWSRRREDDGVGACGTLRSRASGAAGGRQMAALAARQTHRLPSASEATCGRARACPELWPDRSCAPSRGGPRPHRTAPPWLARGHTGGSPRWGHSWTLPAMTCAHGAPNTAARRVEGLPLGWRGRGIARANHRPSRPLPAHPCQRWSMIGVAVCGGFCSLALGIT